MPKRLRAFNMAPGRYGGNVPKIDSIRLNLCQLVIASPGTPPLCGEKPISVAYQREHITQAWNDAIALRIMVARMGSELYERGSMIVKLLKQWRYDELTVVCTYGDAIMRWAISNVPVFDAEHAEECSVFNVQH